MGEDLAELLLRPRGTAAGGSIGRETDWLELFAEFPVTGNVLIADASYIPTATDGLSVALPVGTYRVLLTVLDYREDWRVARLRLTTSEQARRGPLIGRTWTDVGRTAICDLLTLAPKWGTDNEASYAKVATWFESGAPFGVALFGESDPLPIPFVDSGFGDGEYPVTSLVDDQGRRIGFEVRFLSARRRYPSFSAE